MKCKQIISLKLLKIETTKELD